MFCTKENELVELEITKKYLNDMIMSQNTDPNIHFVQMPRFPALRFSFDPLEKIPEECTARSFGSDAKVFGWGRMRLSTTCPYEQFRRDISIGRLVENEEPLDEPPKDSPDEYMKADSYHIVKGITEQKWFRLDPNIHVFLDKDIMRDDRGLYVRLQLIDKTEYPHEYIELIQNVIYFPLYLHLFFLMNFHKLLHRL